MPAEPQGGGGFEPERFEPESLAGLPAGYALRPLPVGRHGLTRSQVVRNQRMRIIGAMLAVLPRHGYAATTIGHLSSVAGVSRAAFYAQFGSKEECFLATYDMARDWLCERVERAAASSAEWPKRVRAGVGATLQLLAANPALARLFAIDAVQAGEAARARQRAFLARYGDALRGGRRDDLALPHELEEMLLGGVLATVARHVESDRTKQLAEATDEVVQYLLIPYLGVVASRRVVAEAA